MEAWQETGCLDLFCLIPWLIEHSIVKLPNSRSYDPQSSVPRLVPTGLVGLTCQVGTLPSITGIYRGLQGPRFSAQQAP